MRRGAAGLAGLFAGTLALLSLAVARPTYREQAIRQFHYTGSVLSRRTMACTFCHERERGGAPWNTFGEALKQGFSDHPTSRFGTVLYEVLREGGDADADGYEDALEVFARTLPGDATSRPKERVEDLKIRFQQAGGVEQYQPPKSARP